MSRGILIVGNESSLTSAIEVEASRRVERYTLALLPDRLSGGDNAPTGLQSWPSLSADKCISLEWNPGSPIAARTLIIAAENRIEQVNEAILVCDPPSIRTTVADLSMAKVEVLVNDYIKGWFFLVKELAAVFRTRGGGVIALVYPDAAEIAGDKDDTVDLLGSTALAAFRALTRGLLAAAFSEPYHTLGFAGTEAGDDAGFASFIFKQLDEGNRRNSGKLHKYGKTGFFR
ncbi:MAG: hypothetical protein FWF55_03490 [Treponema sp.]|nr:hypothetical protein [Treponema sp.]